MCKIQKSALGAILLALLLFSLFSSIVPSHAQSMVWYGYTHLYDNSTHRNVGDHVYEGEVLGQIGPIGISGYGNVDHLHFMKTSVDPTSISRSNLYWIFEDPAGTITPVEGSYASGSYPYGKYNPYDYNNTHTGEDYIAGAGTNVLAVCDGTVVWWGDWPWNGAGSWMNTIWLKCDGGSSSSNNNDENSGGGVPTDEEEEEPHWWDDLPDWLSWLKKPLKAISKIDFPTWNFGKKVVKTVKLVREIAGLYQKLYSSSESFKDAAEKVEIVKKIGEKFNKVATLWELIETEEEKKPTNNGIPEIPEPEKFTYSISAQKPGDVIYQNNIRKFYAWPSSGENLNKMAQMDLEDFEGYWTIPPNSKRSVNEFFGSKAYEQGQGMEIPSTGGIGDGACNAAAFVGSTARRSGLKVYRDINTHNPMPGVPNEDLVTVCIPTGNNQSCSTPADIWVENTYDYPVEVHWKVEGDTLTMWVEGKITVTTDESATTSLITKVAWGRILLVLIAIVVIIFLLFKLFPGKSAQSVLFVVNYAPIIKSIIVEAFKESLRWWFFVLVSVIVLNEPLRELIRVGFSVWVKLDTQIDNWQLAVLFVALTINLLIRRFLYVRTMRAKGGYYVLEKPGAWKRAILILLVVFTVLGAGGFLLWSLSTPTEVDAETEETSPSTPVGSCEISARWEGTEVMQYCDLITKYSNDHNLDPDLTASLIWKESHGDASAISYQGAVGLMQIISSDGLGSQWGFTSRPSVKELLDPETNIRYGTNMLAGLIVSYGSTREALLHYGPTGVGYSYADEVLAIYAGCY